MIKTILITVVLPHGERVRRRHAAPAGCWTEEGIESVIRHWAAQIERNFPGVEFRSKFICSSE